MLLQLHHEFKDRTEFISQKETSTHKERRLWIKETLKEFPVPDSAQWMCCTEESKHFVKTNANRDTL